MFPETEAKFFLKVNDAELVFVKNDSGQVTKAIMNQGGRQADAKKVKQYSKNGLHQLKKPFHDKWRGFFWFDIVPFALPFL